MIRVTAVIGAIGSAFSLATPAAAQRHGIDVQRSTITIHVFESGLFRALADNHLIQATVAGGSIDESAVPHVDLVIEAQRLHVLDPGLSPKDRGQVQARMLGVEVLDATRFSQIRFHSTAVQRLEADRWLVRGDLQLHGQTHDVAVHVTRENGRYIGRTMVRETDFAITPISVAGGTVKVKNEISVEFDIVTADH
jgi:polyisoprenoid-binding protein YceI